MATNTPYPSATTVTAPSTTSAMKGCSGQFGEWTLSHGSAKRLSYSEGYTPEWKNEIASSTPCMYGDQPSRVAIHMLKMVSKCYKPPSIRQKVINTSTKTGLVMEAKYSLTVRCLRSKMIKPVFIKNTGRYGPRCLSRQITTPAGILMMKTWADRNKRFAKFFDAYCGHIDLEAVEIMRCYEFMESEGNLSKRLLYPWVTNWHKLILPIVREDAKCLISEILPLTSRQRKSLLRKIEMASS